MAHEKSVIRGLLMQEFGEYAKTTPVPIWVVQKLEGRYEALGLYTRIASAAAVADLEKMRVTVSKGWASSLLEEGGMYYGDMSTLLEIGAITRIAQYESGKVRFQIETYPPKIRQELDSYRRPDGRLVASFS